ncbi:hypothetical protein J6TS7_29920 [Paenibacillus dendritiformis]|nr:hypothetical protein J6TS7_29920 [Paenibacillus dendritiformis]
MLNRQRPGEKTAFQEIASYEASIDLQTDMVLVYGMDDTMEERVCGWSAQGYRVGLMTGTAWGEYQPYLNGRFDGRQHWDEGQTRANGTRLIHETDDVPYMVPTVSFADYITERLKKAVDAGVDAFFMEEPEFWVEAGYSPSFRREWELYYHEPWMPPHQSPDAQYRASKLKTHLYARAMERISSALKSYAKHALGRHIHVYVATHSLINYCQCCSDPVTLEGPFVDLFDGQLSVRPSVTIGPGEQALLYDLKQAQQSGRELVLVDAAGRVVPQPDDGPADAGDAESLRYTARGPAGVRAVLRFYAPTAPAQATVQSGGRAYPFDLAWDEASSTFTISFIHPAGGVEIAITPGVK